VCAGPVLRDLRQGKSVLSVLGTRLTMVADTVKVGSEAVSSWLVSALLETGRRGSRPRARSCVWCACCRLLPQFTPARALMWGTILAIWGTGAVVMSSSRALDIKRVSQHDPSSLHALLLVWRVCVTEAVPSR
jgi:hypothetical protein